MEASFIVNNVAELLSTMGIKVAINRHKYIYIQK